MQRSWQWFCVVLLVSSLSLVGCAATEEQPTDQGTQTPTSVVETTPQSFEDYKPRLACPDQKGKEEATPCKAVVEMVIESQTAALDGRSILIEVDGDNAPVTAGNFVDLVQRQVYDGLAFHRVIRTPEPFVVQGGDPVSKDRQVPIAALGRGGFVDPTTGVQRDVPLEIKLEGDDAPTYGKAELDPAKVVLKHEKGAIAMARSQFPNSASAQFYFSLAPNAFLNGNYAVFGKVTQGLEVMDQIQMGDRIKSAKVIEGANYLVK